MVDKSAMSSNRLFRYRFHLLLAAALFSAIVLKVSLVLTDRVPFNSDEAIVALMARHILAGEHPVFFYGQAYMGSLDAYLTAIGFYIFGYQVWILRAVQAILYLATIATSALMLWKITGSRAAVVAGAWLLAIPPVNLTLYTTASLGGYGEMLLIGNLILLTTLYLADHLQSNKRGAESLLWLSLGFLIGLGLWSFGLTLVYAFASIAFLAWILVGSRNKPLAENLDGTSRSIQHRTPVEYLSIAAGLLGFVIGAAPWLLYAVNSGIYELIEELAGGAIAGVEGLNLLEMVVRRLFNFVVLGSTVVMGLRPPWEIRWLALPLNPAALLVWSGVFVYVIRNNGMAIRNRSQTNISHLPLFAGVLVTLGIGFCLTPFGADPSGRYFLPATVVLAIMAGEALKQWAAKYSRLIFLIVPIIITFNLWGTVQAATKYPPGLTTQFDAIAQIDHEFDAALIDFLRSAGETRGYTNYWVAYPIAFLSEEEIIYVPRLPYHEDFRYTPRDDRYPVYQELVESSEQVAYITTKHPALDSYLREQFSARDISWKEKMIGDYHVFFSLSKRIEPEELGLGLEIP